MNSETLILSCCVKGGEEHASLPVPATEEQAGRIWSEFGQTSVKKDARRAAMRTSTLYVAGRTPHVLDFSNNSITFLLNSLVSLQNQAYLFSHFII